MKLHSLSAYLLSSLLAGLAGCGQAGVGADSLGATPGGEQDVALFRETVNRGGIPRPAMFTVAGFLAEHDLPLEAPPCTETLCVNAGVGVARALDSGRNEVFVQLGFSSGIDPATFVRPRLNLAAVVDRSGSMAGEKMAAARTALHRLVDRLGPEDQLALIQFDHTTDVLRRPAPVTDRAALHRLIDTIRERGATNIEAALHTGYELVQSARSRDRLDRVILMTDALPNTGRTGTADFKNLVETYAAQDIGLTAMGIGIDFGQELALAITRSRGGNYIFLSNAARIATVFDQDFDFLMTPLAYDLSMTLTAGSGYRIAETYGLPASREGRSATIEAATVFLSRNRGAVLARLVPAMAWDDGRLLAETTLAYSGRDTGAVTRRKPCGYEGGEPLGESTVWFSQRGVSRTVAVVNAGVAVRRALELYAMGRVNEALSQISLGEGALRDQLRSDPASADLRADLDLLQRLQINMDRWQGGYDRPEDPYAHQPYQPPPHYHGPFGCSAAPGAGAPGVLGLGLALLCLVPLLRRRTPGALRA